MSPDSVEQAARLGAPGDLLAAAVGRVGGDVARDLPAGVEGDARDPPPAPAHSDLLYCAPTDAHAEAVARVFMARDYPSVLGPHPLPSGHFPGKRGSA